jgi:hypothetical protein
MSRKPDDIQKLHDLAESGELPPTAAGAVDHLEAHLARRNGHPPEKPHPTDSIIVTQPDNRADIPGRVADPETDQQMAHAASQHARGTQILRDEESRREHRRPTKPRKPADFGRDL